MIDLSRYASDPAFAVTLVELSRFEALMRPPAHAPVMAYQAGITAAMVADRPPAAIVLADFDATLHAPPYVTVAHHAATKAGVLARYAGRHRWSRLSQLHQLAGRTAPAATTAPDALF